MSHNHKIEMIISRIKMMIHLENSSDLEQAPGAWSIADDECFKCIILGVRRFTEMCENTAFHFHAAPFRIQSQPLLMVDWMIM